MALALRAGTPRPAKGSHRADRAALAADVLAFLRGQWPALVVLVVAAVVRLYRIDSVYEIHVDEVSYADAGTSVAQGHGLTMFGVPFHLHPPGYFVVMALVEKALGLVGITEPDRFAQVLHLRPVGAVLGALTCALVVSVVTRLAGRVPALVAGGVLAVDPFANRWDSRVFLEAPATFFSVVAISCLVAVVGTDRPRGRLLVGAGLAVGACTLCKEPYAFLSVLPPLALFVTGRLARRRDTLTILGVAALCNVGFLVGIVLSGDLADFWAEQGSGVRRLVGTDQETGYNAAGAQSAGSTATQHLGEFAPSVVLALLGALSCAVVLLPVLLRLVRERRFADPVLAGRVVTALWTGCAFAYVGYAFGFGTFEEQNVSMLLAPSAVGLGVLVGILVRRGPLLRGVGTLLCVALLASATVTTARIHTRDDDGYLQLRTWLDSAVPVGARISMTETTGQFLYADEDVTGANTMFELQQDHVDLVLLSTELVARGYGTASVDFADQVAARGRLVFTASGESLGDLQVWDVRSVTGGSGRLSRTVLPTVE